MSFFENLLTLMLVAVVLLQLARRWRLPYPALLAGAGVLVALVPGAPTIPIDPETYLALFIAPALVDAAYDFPLGATRRFLGPLIAFAVFAVILTSVSIAFIAHWQLGLPIAAGLALGAIIAPPDAAAATAVLRGVAIPRNTYALLQAESLFNDGTALLIFGTALELISSHALHTGVGLRLLGQVPGGILLGILCAYIAVPATRYVRRTLGGNLLQFVFSYGVWVLAVRFKLSPVLATIAFAMTIAQRSDDSSFSARMRVQSYAVWSLVVFTLNVFAFMLMGMQARIILGRLSPSQLGGALLFVLVVILAVILVRMIVVIGFNRLDAWWERAHGRRERATIGQALFTGWCGMRGFVTMATALALPNNFPQRDVVVLTAFCVVLATLVLQGLTLTPLARMLKFDQSSDALRERSYAHAALAESALDSIRDETGAEADSLRYRLSLVHENCSGRNKQAEALKHFRELGLRTILAKRKRLDKLREQNEISIEHYLQLQEEVDWAELTMLTDDDRRIEEI